MKESFLYKINILCDTISKLIEVKKIYLWDKYQKDLFNSYLEYLKLYLLELMEINNEK